MKLCLVGIADIPLGKRNVKDPRLDVVDQLVEADKKVYVQIDLVDETELATADAILVHRDRRPDLILHDLEFIETRLGRDVGEAEKAVLEKLKAALEQESCVSAVALSESERGAVAAHAFLTSKPVVVAQPEEVEEPDALFVRAYREGGFISFLTVGGKENRAWKIRRDATAWDAAGVIHTDIQRGFIRAEVIRYDDLVQAGGETQAKRAGKQRLEIKTYVMQDFDVVNFRFNK
jgi:ribosome-binding ATPase YchF (GTP1/OBG family)